MHCGAIVEGMNKDELFETLSQCAQQPNGEELASNIELTCYTGRAGTGRLDTQPLCQIRSDPEQKPCILLYQISSLVKVSTIWCGS